MISPSSLQLAVVQFRAETDEVEVERARLLALCAESIAAGAQLIVLPELALTRYLFANQAEARALAEVTSGASASAFQLLADQSGACIVWGFIEDAGEKLYNSALIMLPKRPPLLYRKRYLFIEDERWATSGDLPYPIWELNGWRLTVGICMDLNDDRFIEWCEQERIDCIAFPTNWLDEGIDIRPYWAARISSTRALLAAANAYGAEREIAYRGQSSILSATTLYAELPRSGDGWRSVRLRRRALSISPESPMPG
ncbi:MAG: carbon-nitrogen hydrolase family protein [Myxococcota bacterium]|nr:carbon-nitrogen hydrolase family protein [Myxococcota bacterium]